MSVRRLLFRYKSRPLAAVHWSSPGPPQGIIASFAHSIVLRLSLLKEMANTTSVKPKSLVCVFGVYSRCCLLSPRTPIERRACVTLRLFPVVSVRDLIASVASFKSCQCVNMTLDKSCKIISLNPRKRISDRDKKAIKQCSRLVA